MKTVAWFLPLLLLVATGCIRVEQRLAIKADGSGTFKVEYAVPDETTQRIQAMLKLADELAKAGGEAPAAPAEDDFTRLVFDPNEPILRQRLESYAAQGIHIDKLEVVARNARKEVKVELRFDNVAQLPKTDFFDSYGFSLVKGADGNYVFFTRPATKEKLDPAWNTEDPDDYKMLAPLLGGFHFSLEVQPPGPILKASAPTRQTPYSAVWVFDFDANTMAVADLQRKQMTIVFSGENITLPDVRQPATPAAASPSVPTLAPETNAPVAVGS